MSTTGQAVAGAAGGASALFSFWNLSTPTGLWITMNQFQLILLLLLTKSNIPKSIIDYLAGLKATTWSFNFIPFKDIPGFGGIVNDLDFKLKKKELTYFGVISGSTFTNNFSLMWILMIFVVIHLNFMMIDKLLRKKVSSKKKWVKWLERVHQFFAYSLYIRLFLEAYIFLLLTSFAELYQWNTSSTSKIVSLFFAFVGAWICVTIVSLSLINWYKLKSIEKTDNYIPLKEFFSGIRAGKFSRLYATLLLSRRVFFVMLLILGQSLTNIALIVPMIIVQIAYLTNLIIVKPFKQRKDNIIEIVNEWFYLLLVSLLSYFNTEDRWAGVMENIYLWIILGNSMTIIMIMISKN